MFDWRMDVTGHCWNAEVVADNVLVLSLHHVLCLRLGLHFSFFPHCESLGSVGDEST